jgi:hypothetical protein
MDLPTSNLPANPPVDQEGTRPWLRLTDAEHEAAEGQLTPESAEALREEARQLLVTLKVDRSRVESRLAEFGLDDPIEVVKGASALDEAINRCQQAIERLDQLADGRRNG